MPESTFDKNEPIHRKPHVPEEDRTPDRDAAADVIEDMWPADFQEIADEAGYSRSHIANTARSYFTQRGRESEQQRRGVELVISVPGDVDDPPSYVEGFVDGVKQAYEEGVR